MLLATTDARADYKILGMVRGTAMRTRHLGMDIMASLRKLVGGQMPEYAQMIEEAREAAIAEMTEKAQELGANAIICIRFATSNVTQGAAEVIVYGTAVKI